MAQESVHMANGIKIGEVSSNSAIIWTRLTKNPERNVNGIPFPINHLWLVEGRDFRSANNAPDGPEKTIWGVQQKQWFYESVRKSDATFRILISPTPIVGPDRHNKNDNHANKGFTYEGNEIRSFIAKQTNMFVVCGDRHWQYVSVDPKTGVKEFSCGPTTDAHAGGFKERNRSDMHRYLRVREVFCQSQSIERTELRGRFSAIMELTEESKMKTFSTLKKNAELPAATDKK